MDRYKFQLLFAAKIPTSASYDEIFSMNDKGENILMEFEGFLAFLGLFKPENS